MIQAVLAFVSAYGALLIWNLPRYRALAHYLVFQALLMLLNLYEAYSADFLVTPALTLVKGPLLYLFVRALVGERAIRGFRLYGQFLPPVALILTGADARVAIGLGSVSQIIYLALSFRLLHRYHDTARDFRSDVDSVRLTWLGAAYWMIAAQAVLGLIRLNLQPALAPALLLGWFSLDLLLLLGVCCFLLFKALRQQLLYDAMLVHESVRRKTPAREREIDAREARSVFARLDSLIVESKLYRKPRLSVDDLACQTGLQMKDISWAFNIGANTSFNDYVNRLRVDAFKQLLEGPDRDRKSLMEIAFECGFNSKSSFNAIFKREVGMTPSQYLRSKALTRGVTGESNQAIWISPKR